MAVTPTKDKSGGSIRWRRVSAGVSVTVSVVAAVAIVILLNYLVHYLAGQGRGRWDFQRLGQFGLSERTERIVERLDQDVTITILYDRSGRDVDRRQVDRVEDYCRDLADRSEHVRVEVVRDDEARLAVIDRLSRDAQGRYADHAALIERFRQFSVDGSARLTQAAAAWRSRGDLPLLSGFRIPAAMDAQLTFTASTLQSAGGEVDARLSRRRVPDYPTLAEDVLAATQGVQQSLQESLDHLEELRGLQQQLSADDAAAVEQFRQRGAQIESLAGRLVDVVGRPGDPMPDDPAGTLGDFAESASEVLAVASGQLARITQLAQQYPILRSHPQFMTEAVVQGRPMRVPADEGLQAFAQMLAGISSEARQIAASQPAPVQQQVLTDLREMTPMMTEIHARLTGSLLELLESLARPDEPSAAVLAAIHDGPLQEVVDEAGAILEAGEQLDRTEDQDDLAGDMMGENLVLIEVASGDSAVIDYDQIWPVAQNQAGGAAGQLRRVFNGDTAIGQRLLSLTQPPLAEVVVAYYETQSTPYMPGPAVSGMTPRNRLNTLIAQLRQANLTVTEWNLAAPMGSSEIPPLPAPAQADRPRVLLVLPLPEPGQANPRIPAAPFTQAHFDRIAQAIDGGMPAVILTGYDWRAAGLGGDEPRSPLHAYLREHWSLNIRDDLMVVTGRADPELPDQFDIDVLELSYLRLPGFTDQPIAKPLRTRHTHWLALCPITRMTPAPTTQPAATTASAPAEVQIEPLLRVTDSMRNVWATPDPTAFEQMGFRGIEPDPQSDMLAPFDVAVLARSGGRAIVVAGVVSTYMDMYVNSPAQQIVDGVPVESSGPPTATLDLVTNACYYLAGREGWIAAGPADAAPIGDVGDGAMRALRIILIGLLPVSVVTLGAFVGVLRKR